MHLVSTGNFRFHLKKFSKHKCVLLFELVGSFESSQNMYFLLCLLAQGPGKIFSGDQPVIVNVQLMKEFQQMVMHIPVIDQVS